MHEENKDKLKIKLIDFKELTEKLLNSIEKELIDSIDELFLKRQGVIDDINKLQYSDEEFKNICLELNIVALSKQLEQTVMKKRTETIEKMNNLKEQSAANRSYAQNSSVNRSFFSTKI
jgi:hypothetical protein